MSKLIKLAIPSAAPGGLDADRSGHFGHCDCFTIIDILDGKQTNLSILENPPHEEGGCLAPVSLLANNGVDAIAVSGIGMRPLLGFQSAGIDVILGEGTTVKETVSAFLKGTLQTISQEGTCGGGCSH
ncbi:MAG TPA: NifB/NifX family molybdenum-iron cluster-binding protein [Bacillota bacterium]|jgi:predicted Fe-Mo cluster-binding NifX family protein|nr:NifB/NifX family molybdenum-iron cluster-binding protein [Bacillota bacterium]